MIEYYDSAFNSSRFLLWLSGMRPFKNHIKPVTYFFIVAEILYNILTITTLFYDKTFMDIADFVVTQVLNFNVVIRVATLMYYEKQFQNVFQDMGKLSPITSPQLHAVMKYLKYSQRVVLAQVFFCVVAIVTHSLLTGERLLHFYKPEWIPETLFGIVFVDGYYIYASILWIGFDMFFLTITIILLVQYRIFHESLRGHYMSSGRQNKSSMKHCIAQGNLLKRITDRINTIFGPMLLVYIWLIVVSLGLLMCIVYESNENLMGSVRYFIILICIIILIFFFYVTPAQLLTIEINEMFDSIYCSNWHECSLPMQQSLLMILTKKKTNAVITTFGKLVEINFRTCTSMVRTCFSIFTFLIHMKNPK